MIETLLDPSGLLGHRLLTFTRTRVTLGEPDPDSGAPAQTTTTSTLTAHFRWLSNTEAQDFKSDPAAALITEPGTLLAGDALTHATLGRFLVLEEGPYRTGPFDRVPLRRA